jgi:hypothetical protein
VYQSQVQFIRVRSEASDAPNGCPAPAVLMPEIGAEDPFSELESVCGCKPTVGSNPTATASHERKRGPTRKGRVGILADVGAAIGPPSRVGATQMPVSPTDLRAAPARRPRRSPSRQSANLGHRCTVDIFCWLRTFLVAYIGYLRARFKGDTRAGNSRLSPNGAARNPGSICFSGLRFPTQTPTGTATRSRSP